MNSRPPLPRLPVLILLASGCEVSLSTSSGTSEPDDESGVGAADAAERDDAPPEAGAPGAANDAGAASDGSLVGSTVGDAGAPLRDAAPIDAALTDAALTDAALTDAALTDSGPGDASVGDPEVARGAYIVESVIGCARCHASEPEQHDPTLSGGCAAGELSCSAAPNLTNHPQLGLGRHTDEQARALLVQGTRSDGTFLRATKMPYYVYAGLTPTDVEAVLAYLRSLDATGESPLPEPGIAELPASPWLVDDLPEPVSAGPGADDGRYLALIACADCHTPLSAAGASRPVNAAAAFSGGRPYFLADGVVCSSNLTGGQFGVADWTPQQFIVALRSGLTPSGKSIAPGLRHRFDLSDADAAALVDYLQALPATPHGQHFLCGL